LGSSDVIVLDGNLEAKYSGEEKILSELYSMDVNICGLAKTCDLFTNKGTSVISALNNFEVDDGWYYYPIAKTNEKHEIVFVKLNEKFTKTLYTIFSRVYIRDVLIVLKK
jgi:hypothetical protein